MPGTARAYADHSVESGVSYEYRVMRLANGYVGYGYINAGIEIAEVPFRGTLLLLIDSTLTMPLATELSRLQHDIEMDGWLVRRFDLGTLATVASVKNLIKQQYVLDPGAVRAVFLVGHIAVPYSGEIAPDGHPNHVGAWPADVYYGDMNGIWTDISVDDSAASDPRNQNVPGDGKFDQSTLPSDVELEVGRVDFVNLPVYTENAVTLMKEYLDRDHAFRTKAFTPENRAVIDDNFGAFSGEAFASSAYRSFAPLVGSANILPEDYQTTLKQGSYLLSYGCGGGSYTSCGGVGTSQDFAGDSLQTVFTMLFGSYFGDWDSNNNLMRTALASGTTLAITWSGRPYWMLHHMGLGETIGYCARLTQNNSTLYTGNYGMRFVHIALLGDPTLRLNYVRPPQTLMASLSDATDVQLQWTPSTDTVIGYEVYRRMHSSDPFVRINHTVVTGTTYADSCLLDAGTYEYMVRAVLLQVTPSGSYYNLSNGVTDSVQVDSDHHITAAFLLEQSGDSVIITNSAVTNATTFFWDFGDGQTSGDTLPVHFYQSAGHYVVSLIASSRCDADTVSQSVDILSAQHDLPAGLDIQVYPNPTHGTITLITSGIEGRSTLRLYSAQGFLAKSREIRAGVNEFTLDDLPPGMYILALITAKGSSLVRKIYLY